MRKKFLLMTFLLAIIGFCGTNLSAENTVAKVDNTEYETIDEAITAAQNGETITLIDNVVLAERVTIPADKTLTIDLNGKSISMEESIIATAYAINNLGNLTITDGVGGGSINARGIYNGYGDGAANVATAKIIVLSGTINAEGTNGGGAAIFNYGVADIQGGTFNSASSYAIALQTGSTMTIGENAIITGGINSWQSTLTINGGTISNDKSGKHVVYAGESDVTINGGTFHNNNSGNATIMASGSTAAVEITGGTFTLNIVDASSSYLIDATSSATYTISGGSFTGGIRAQGGTKYEITGGTFTNEYGNYNVYEGGDINISGGTFTGSYAQEFATDNLAAGYELNGDGTVVVYVVAKIGEETYPSLQAAIENVKEGETITVLEDITFTTGANGSTNGISYTRGASFTLDLNGKTITSDLGNNAFRFKIGDGNTVKDTEVTVLIKNGKIVSDSNNWCAISAATADNSGNKLILNLTDLIIEANKAGDFAVKSWPGAVVNTNNVDVTSNYAGGFYAVGGEIVLDENSSVAQKGLHTSPFMSYAFGVSSGTGKMTINGGIYSAVPAATTDAYDQGASHGSSVGGVMSSGGTLIINGGTFSNDNFGDAEPTAPRSLIMADAGAKVKIIGGTFNAMAKIVDPTNNTTGGTNAEVTISGGTFSADPTDAPYNLVKLAEDYVAVENNGVWNVVKAAAKIGDVYYETAFNALKNAKDNETVTFLAGTHILGDLTHVHFNANGDKSPKYLTIQGEEGETVVVDKFYFNTNAFPEYLTIKNITIDGKESGAMQGISSHTAVTGLTVENCTFKNGAFVSLADQLATYVTVKNNSFDGTGVDMSTAVYVQKANGLTVTGNTITGGFYNAVQCSSEAANITIDGNTINGTNDRALRFGTVKGAVAITNNKFYDATDDANELLKATKVDGGSIAFTGNTYDDIPWNPATINSGDNVVVVSFVATVNGVKYATLAEAVSAAESGATITLLNGEHELPLFAGKELTFKGESKEGVIVNDAPDATTQGWNGSTFHFENLTAKGATVNYHGLANDVVAVTYKDCIIKGLRFLYATNGVSFEDCTFNAQGVEHSFWTYGASNVTVKNSTFTYTDRAVNCYSENGAEHEADITFEGCSFTYAGTKDAPEGAVEINSGSAKSFDITFTDCTAPAKGDMWFNSQWDSKKGENTVVTIDDEIVWQVLPVAKIGNVEYKSLQAAIDAATEGDIVTVINDVELESTVTIAAGKVVTLDLNGKTINTAWENESAEKHYYAFINKGTLTITDNSAEANGVINARGNYNDGILTLEKGTINAIDHNGGYGVQNREGSKFTMNGGLIATTNENGDTPGSGYDATTVRVDNGAEFIMNGGKINNISNFTIAIDNYGKTTINENAGEVKSVHTTVANHGTMTIYGGTFICDGLEGVTAHALWTTVGKTTINGGTFNGKDNYNGFNVDASAGAVVEINGGNFEPVHSGSLYGDGTITVSGGTFFDDVSERCAFGYTCQDKGDDTYGIVETTSFEIPNLNRLIAFRNAVNAGNTFAGQTVTVTADINMESVENWTPIGTAEKPFMGTFDGGEHTIKGLKLITDDVVDGYGFFGVVGSANNDVTVTVKNLKFEGVTVSATNGENVGTVIGIMPRGCKSNLTINNVTVESGSVSAKKHTAGLLGKSYTTGNLTIENCVNKAAITGGGSGNVGGIVAIISEKPATVTIKNTENHGNVTHDGAIGVGGIVGNISGEAVTTVTINDCKNTGNVSATGNCSVSGIANIGKIVKLIISNVENTGVVYAPETNSAVAGLVASTQCQVEASGTLKNSGNVTGKKIAAGIIGHVIGNTSTYNYNNVSFINEGDIIVTEDGDENQEGAGAIFAIHSSSDKFTQCSFTNTGTISAVEGSTTGLIASCLTSATRTFINCVYSNTGIINSATGNGSGVSDHTPSFFSVAKAWVENGLFGKIVGGNQISDGTYTTEAGAINLGSAFAKDGTLFVMFNNEGWVNDKKTVEYNGNEYTIKREAINPADWRYTYSVIYVAKIGDVEYTSLADAYTAATDGDIITLLDNITLNEKFVIERSITLDGNGKTITYTGNGASARAIDVPATEDAELDVTIKNLTVDCTSSYCQRGINYNEDGKLTLESVTVKGTNVTYALNLPGSSDNCEVAINNSSLTGNIALNVWGADAEINATDSHFTSVDNATHENYAAVKLNNNGTDSAERTVITITGGSITAMDENEQPSSATTNATATGVINISETTEVTGNNETIVAIVTYEGANEFYGCFTLQEAIDTAGDDSKATVKLLCNVTLSEKVIVNKSVVIDLNGKTVTANCKKAFEVYANATIKNGTIIGENRCVDTRKAVELTLTDVNLVADNYTSAYGNPQPLTIGGSENGTKVVMTNVNISAVDGYGIITFVKTNLTATESAISGYSALYVKPGSDNSVFNFVNSDLSGSTIGNDVEGNSFSTIAVRANYVAVNVDAESTVTANGDHCYAISFIGTSENTTTGSSVTVAGEITGNILDDPNGNTVMVKPEYADELAAAGYATIEAENGLVSVIKAVAKIGETLYASLQDAFNAATEGQTVTVINDVELESNVTVAAGKVVTLDLNGKNLTGGAYVNLYINGELTIEDNVGNAVSTFRNHYVLNGGKLTLKSGILQNIETNTGGYGIFIDKGGESIIEGGTVQAVNKSNYAICVKGTLTIVDGNIVGKHGVIAVENQSAIVTIKDGEYTLNAITGYSDHIVYVDEENAGKVNIEGGNFTFNNFIANEGDSMIDAAEENVSITGGTYTQNVNEWCAPGYEAVQIGENVYEVRLSSFEKFYTAGGVETTSDNAAYSLSFNVTDYANKELSVKIGSKKPAQNSSINLVTPVTATFDGITFNVTSVADNGFNGTRFKTITISEGVRTLGTKALANMYDLTSVVFPQTLVSVGDNCFHGYGNSHKIKSITSYAIEAPAASGNWQTVPFQQCIADVAVLIVPNASSYTEYKESAGWSRFTNILGIGSTKEIAGKDDKYTLLATVTSMNPMESSIQIGNTKPASNSNAELVLPEVVDYFPSVEGLDFTVTSIPNNAFSTCYNFTGNLEIPATVKTIGNSAFLQAYYNKLNVGKLTLNEGLETILNSAFTLSYFNNENLVIPASVTTIGSHAFNATNMSGTLTVKNNIPGGFSGFAGSLFTKVVVEEGVTSIVDSGSKGVFSNMSKLETVILPSTLEEIGVAAFSEDPAITTITINAAVPPTVQNANVFEQEVYSNATLFVPDHAAKKLYKEANVWEKFVNISTPIITQTTQLIAGWNWFSYYVDTDLAELETALGENGLYIKNQISFVDYSDGLWGGTMSSISPDEMYMIKINNDVNITLTGEMFDITEQIIELKNNWTWIGFPSSVSVDINAALSNFEPNDGDVIKGHGCYADYYDGVWGGTLSRLEPGKAYMYKNTSGVIKQFTYNTSSKSETRANITTENNHWVPNASQYANNMTMTAMVDVEGGDYEVAAFVDGEVRGSARPIYVESIDAYVLFLTIHGEGVEEMTFKFYDLATGEESALNDRINYSDDAIVGSLKEPYMFNRGTTGIGEASLSDINIYPNPTTTGKEINLQATCDKVEVFNALGVKVAEYQNVDSIDAIETAGIYVIRLTNNGNVKHCSLVVK